MWRECFTLLLKNMIDLISIIYVLHGQPGALPVIEFSAALIQLRYFGLFSLSYQDALGLMLNLLPLIQMRVNTIGRQCFVKNLVFTVVVVSDSFTSLTLQFSNIFRIPWQAVCLLTKNATTRHSNLKLGEFMANGAIYFFAQTVVRLLVLMSGDSSNSRVALFSALAMLKAQRAMLVLITSSYHSCLLDWQLDGLGAVREGLAWAHGALQIRTLLLFIDFVHASKLCQPVAAHHCLLSVGRALLRHWNCSQGVLPRWQGILRVCRTLLSQRLWWQLRWTMIWEANWNVW